MNLTINPIQLKDYIQTLPNNIVLYGAGGFGRELAAVFATFGIKPVAFLDKKASGSLLGIDICHPEKFPDKNVTIILSIVLNEKIRAEIFSYLQQLGFNNIIDGQTIRARYVEFEKDYIFNDEDILKPLSYLADPESLRVYRHNVEAHLSRNYEHSAESDHPAQYFVKIKGNHKFSSFVDCGAYIGDTLLSARENGITIENYYAFEPIVENFTGLKLNVSRMKQNVSQMKTVLRNMAVSNFSGTLNFDSMLGASRVNQNGTTTATVVTLDEVLKNIKIDFLKMDIEGEEMQALRGAKKIIRAQKPNMAICVYHYINHFWDIPNLIQEWDLNYALYMRTHSSAGMETVLYAIQEDA